MSSSHSGCFGKHLPKQQNLDPKGIRQEFQPFHTHRLRAVCTQSCSCPTRQEQSIQTHNTLQSSLISQALRHLKCHFWTFRDALHLQTSRLSLTDQVFEAKGLHLKAVKHKSNLIIQCSQVFPSERSHLMQSYSILDLAAGYLRTPESSQLNISSFPPHHHPFLCTWVNKR